MMARKKAAAKRPAKKAAKKAAPKKSTALPKEVKAKLQSAAKSLGIPKDTVMKVWGATLAEWKQKLPKEKPKTVQMRALRSTIIRLRSEYSGVRVTAFIFGVGDIIDFTRKAMRDAKALYAKNRNLAVKKGITDRDGTPLDTRAKLPNNEPNPSYGQPMQSRPFRRMLSLVKWEASDGEKQEFSSVLLDDTIDPPTVNTVVQFNADRIDTSTDPPRIYLPRTVNFEEAEEQPDPIVFLDDSWPDDIVPFYDLANVVIEDQEAGNKYKSYQTEVDVQELDLMPNSNTGSRTMYVFDVMSDSDDVVRVFVPPHLEIDFGVESRVRLVCEGRHTEKYGLTLSALGIYALPDYRTEPPVTEETEEEDEEWGDDDYDETPAEEGGEESEDEESEEETEEESTEEDDEDEW